MPTTPTPPTDAYDAFWDAIEGVSRPSTSHDAPADTTTPAAPES
jgi:hypothetical protein